MDARTGVYMNRNLAKHLVPTFADVAEQTVIMVPADDTEVNAEGVKGLGEIEIIGVAAAVVNAAFNATGVRVRDLTLRPESMLNYAPLPSARTQMREFQQLPRVLELGHSFNPGGASHAVLFASTVLRSAAF